MRERFGSGVWFLLLVSFVACCFSGCGTTNDDFVFIGDNPQGAAPVLFNLTVGANPAALARSEIRAQIGVGATQFRITIYDLNTVQVGQQTVDRNATAIFPLPQANYLIRVEGLNAANGVVGYYDRVVFLNSSQTILAPGLRLTNAPPAPDSQGAQTASPYFLFTASPSSADGGASFAVTAQVFSGTGEPANSTFTGVTLTSNSLPFAVAPAPLNTDANGVVTFNVNFPSTAEGSTTLTVRAGGVDAATSNSISVSAANVRMVERVSLDSMGNQSAASSRQPSISGDGRHVTFESSAALTAEGSSGAEVYLYDRDADTVQLISKDTMGGFGDLADFEASISSDGMVVAFVGESNDLVPGDTGEFDIFAFESTGGTLERVSLDNMGNPGDNTSQGRPSLSSDGRFVAFTSQAGNLVPGDTNGFTDAFVYDRTNDTIERVSVDSMGNEADSTSFNVSISGDGRYVAFSSNARNLVPGDTNLNVDIFVYDRNTDTIERVSLNNTGAEANGGCINPAISADGRYVAFGSQSVDNLVTGINGNQIYLYDREMDTVEAVSQVGGVPGNGQSDRASISADGRYVAFSSEASNLVPDDTNGTYDVFVFDRTTKQIARASVDVNGNQATGGVVSRGLSLPMASG